MTHHPSIWCRVTFSTNVTKNSHYTACNTKLKAAVQCRWNLFSKDTTLMSVCLSSPSLSFLCIKSCSKQVVPISTQFYVLTLTLPDSQFRPKKAGARFCDSNYMLPKIKTLWKPISTKNKKKRYKRKKLKSYEEIQHLSSTNYEILLWVSNNALNTLICEIVI